MKKKLLAIALIVTLIAALAACGSAGSGGGALSALSETAARETARPITTARAEWSLDDIESLSDAVTGITDREYVAGEGSARGIREDMTFDREVIHTVLLNTASVRFGTPGEYPMTYWVYFDAAALADRTDAADMGFDIPDADRLAVAVHATVTVTDPEKDEEDVADEGLAETEAAGAVTASSGGGPGSSSGSTGSSSKSSGSTSKSSGSSSKSSGSGSGSSSGSGSGSQAAGCSHVWVEVTEEVAVREGRYVCNNCGYSSTDGMDVVDHTMFVCNCGYSSKRVTVGTETVGTGTYVCSRCGATK